MPSRNNFDLIRLVAALQVAVTHAAGHLGVGARDSVLLGLAELFPGVPIFFFISGFLISKSFEKNPALQEFALNRALRIYPGLIACFFVSLAMVWFTGYFATVRVPLSDLMFWVAAQLSVAQFYNPGFLRGYGVGVLNGSMWTISVELQFYVLVPIIYALFRLRHVSLQVSNRILIALALAFLCASVAHVSGALRFSDALWYKLAGVTFAPWFYMFLVGVLFQRNFAVLKGWLAGRFLPLFVVYCVAALLATHFLGAGMGNHLNPLLFLALAVVTFAAAFSHTTLSDKLLGRNDLSYGVYVYHMPVVNLLLAAGMAGSARSLLVAIALTLVLAYASWRLVEKPALGFKRHPLYQHDPATLSRQQS